MADEHQEKPSFADVVKAFTPPGTDFDEFKRALHSQGAPGAISPQMVEMLNKATAAGAIPGGLMAQSGTTCARCDHPHGGPPGPRCLEVEAHLGRSPSRRRPDLQLDAISGKRTDPGPCYGPDCDHVSHPSPTAEPDFPPGMPSVSAVAAHEQFIDFRRGGFTEDQAIKLLAALIAASSTDKTDT